MPFQLVNNSLFNDKNFEDNATNHLRKTYCTKCSEKIKESIKLIDIVINELSACNIKKLTTGCIVLVNLDFVGWVQL